MSRVAKAPIKIPANVELSLAENQMTVKGPKGVLSQHVNKLVTITRDAADATIILFDRAEDHPKAWSHAGTARALLNNMIKGVTEGFSRTLELVGVGYRAQSQGKVLNLSLGFSHAVEYKLPEGVVIETPTNTSIVIRGIDKQLLGQVASEIRAYRKPEPYKGKGVKYANEYINRKEAKKK